MKWTFCKMSFDISESPVDARYGTEQTQVLEIFQQWVYIRTLHHGSIVAHSN